MSVDQSWSLEDRRARLMAWAEDVERRRHVFVTRIVEDVFKPVTMAHDEVSRAVAHIHSAAMLDERLITRQSEISAGVTVERRPLGRVAAIMPWNNPLALPASKIAPALVTGNSVVLKPAPSGSGVADLLMESLRSVGIGPELASVVHGDAEAGAQLAASPDIDGVTLTGSIVTGRHVAAACTRYGKPLQAELGGNNAAIIFGAVNLDEVVPQLVHNAYAFAGQRCTAIRRFIVERRILEEFVARAQGAISDVVVGNPNDPATVVGPVISAAAAHRIVDVIEQATRSGAQLILGDGGAPNSTLLSPTLLLSDDPAHAVVQEETFGPVAVIQPADDLDHALALANGVEQGLLMAVCSEDDSVIASVQDRARVGIVQIGARTVPVHPEAPFGGWKASGIGSPEHGVWDAQFYLRDRAVYRL